MVEGAALEKQYASNGIEGSNPSLSAKSYETPLRGFSSRRQNGIHFGGLLFQMLERFEHWFGHRTHSQEFIPRMSEDVRFPSLSARREAVISFDTATSSFTYASISSNVLITCRPCVTRSAFSGLSSMMRFGWLVQATMICWSSSRAAAASSNL